MPFKIFFAFSGFVMAFLCSSLIDYRFIESNSSGVGRLIVFYLWASTPIALWLLLRRNLWAGYILAVVTGTSMVFLRLNIDWLHKEGFLATFLVSLATV